MRLLTVPCLPRRALARLDVAQQLSIDEIIFPAQPQTQNACLARNDRLLTSCLVQLMSRIAGVSHWFLGRFQHRARGRLGAHQGGRGSTVPAEPALPGWTPWDHARSRPILGRERSTASRARRAKATALTGACHDCHVQLIGLGCRRRGREQR